jgi:phage gp29-like protein
MIDVIDNAITDQDLQLQAEALLGPVFDLVQSAASFDEVLDGLAQLDLPSGEIDALLAQAMFAADVIGRTAAGQEN